MSRLAALAAAGRIEAEVELAPLTTYKFGGPATWFALVEDPAAVAEAAEAAAADGVPVLVVGRGSNLVVSDAGFPGLVIRLGGELATMSIDESGIVHAGAAMALPKLARTCAKAGRGGLEFLVAVPGSVGGAVRMNAGCHGSETGEWLVRVLVYRPAAGLVEVARGEMEMTYRHNSLPPDDIILRAELTTVPRSTEEAERLMRSITKWRKEHQPGGTYNAGSVFKNPPHTSAGFLIDSLGLKGLAVGGAKVSARHANFFEASPGASAQDVYDLVWEVRRRVADETGIELEAEIRFAGPFASHLREPKDRGDRTTTPTDAAGEGQPR